MIAPTRAPSQLDRAVVAPVLNNPDDPTTAPAAGQDLLTTPEEALVTDTRAGLTPSQLVERKLISLLKSNPLPISHVQMLSTGLSRRR